MFQCWKCPCGSHKIAIYAPANPPMNSKITGAWDSPSRCTERANQIHVITASARASLRHVHTSKPRCHLRFFTAGRRFRSGTIYARTFPPRRSSGERRGEREREKYRLRHERHSFQPFFPPHPRCLFSPPRAASIENGVSAPSCPPAAFSATPHLSATSSNRS